MLLLCVREQETFQRVQVRVAQVAQKLEADAQKAERVLCDETPEAGRLMLRSLALLLQVLRMFVF